MRTHILIIGNLRNYEEREKNEENNTRNCKSAVKKCHNASLKDNNGKNSGVISDCKKNILIVAVCV